MFAVLHALVRFAADLFKSRCRLEAENSCLPELFSLIAARAISRDGQPEKIPETCW